MGDSIKCILCSTGVLCQRGSSSMSLLLTSQDNDGRNGGGGIPISNEAEVATVVNKPSAIVNGF